MRCSVLALLVWVMCSSPNVVAQSGARFDPQPLMEKPLLGRRFADPSFGSKIIRLTASENVSRHVYSLVQAENASAQWYFYKDHGPRDTRVVIRTVHDNALHHIVPGDVAYWNSSFRWANTEPDIAYIIRDQNGSGSQKSDHNRLAITRYNVRKQGPERVIDLSQAVHEVFPQASAIGGRGISALRADDTEIALHARDGTTVLGFFIYHFASDKVVASITRAQLLEFIDASRMDRGSVSLSPSGEHVYIANKILPRDLDPATHYNGGTHGSFARLADGSEVYVYTDSNDGYIKYIDFSRDALVNIQKNWTDGGNAASNHSSGIAQIPGWFVYSTYFSKLDTPYRFDNRVMLLEIAEQGRSINLAHNQVCKDRDYLASAYYAQPHATPSRDLSRIYFASDFGRCNAEQRGIELYRLDVPEPIRQSLAGPQ